MRFIWALHGMARFLQSLHIHTPSHTHPSGFGAGDILSFCMAWHGRGGIWAWRGIGGIGGGIAMVFGGRGVRANGRTDGPSWLDLVLLVWFVASRRVELSGLRCLDRVDGLF
jgi:hypothetical protein